MFSHEKKGLHRPQGGSKTPTTPTLNHIKTTTIMNDNHNTNPDNQPILATTATPVAGAINEATFWLEGLIDGSNPTREEALALLAKSICSLQAAYSRLMFE